MNRKIVSLMWIVGMTILLLTILTKNIFYQLCTVIIGHTIIISSLFLEKRFETEKLIDEG